MAISINNNFAKMRLPNGKVVDILSSVFGEMKNWIQEDLNSPESGGFLVGYQHKVSGNISLENISHPYPMDKRSRFFFT